VRIANLSLLNTDWYIQQLRDEAPKLPMRLDDATIKALGVGAFREPDGRIIYTNEFMVHHLIEQSRSGDGWSNQPYFAVTVPEHYGYEHTFTLEGLVYRVNRDTLQGSINVPVTVNSLYDVFKYRGLFRADGSWDSTVYKDENATTLSRNYAAAHIQLAYWYRRHGKLDDAIAEMERVGRMFPDFTEVLVPLGSFYIERHDTTKALELFRRLTTADPRNPEARYYFGVTLASQNQLGPAVQAFDAAIQLDPDYPNPYYAAYYALWQARQYPKAIGYLDRWLDLHPQDAQARELLDTQRQSIGMDSGGRPRISRPPSPQLP